MTAQNDEPQTSGDDDIEYVSKTQMKKEMLALQELAVYVSQLSAEQRAQLPLTPELIKAIDETKNIKKREALRRHHQYMGRLMRSADHQAIEQTIDDLKAQKDRLVRMMHVMEGWRDDLIDGGPEVLQRFFDEFPNADRQDIRNLVRGAQQERRNKKTPTNARKLFKLIRDLYAKEQ